MYYDFAYAISLRQLTATRKKAYGWHGPLKKVVLTSTLRQSLRHAYASIGIRVL